MRAYEQGNALAWLSLCNVFLEEMGVYCLTVWGRASPQAEKLTGWDVNGRAKKKKHPQLNPNDLLNLAFIPAFYQRALVEKQLKHKLLVHVLALYFVCMRDLHCSRLGTDQGHCLLKPEYIPCEYLMWHFVNKTQHDDTSGSTCIVNVETTAKKKTKHTGYIQHTGTSSKCHIQTILQQCCLSLPLSLLKDQILHTIHMWNCILLMHSIYFLRMYISDALHAGMLGGHRVHTKAWLNLKLRDWFGSVKLLLWPLEAVLYHSCKHNTSHTITLWMQSFIRWCVSGHLTNVGPLSLFWSPCIPKCYSNAPGRLKLLPKL